MLEILHGGTHIETLVNMPFLALWLSINLCGFCSRANDGMPNNLGPKVIRSFMAA